MKAIILASTSPYRAELLQRLGLVFTTATPDCDETPLAGESAADLVFRLSLKKAASLKDRYRDALIIASDQVAECAGSIVGKPGDHTQATRQLRMASGHRMVFHTGLCVYDAKYNTYSLDEATTQVEFRTLTDTQIERYLQIEKPYYCAGSCKSEGLGIALFRSIVGDDPSALIGLPLIRLTTILNNLGIHVP